MAGKNYGPNVSGYLDPTGRNWEDVIFQAGKAILDRELNLGQDIDVGQAEQDIRRGLPSGWLASEFLNASPGNLAMFVSSPGSNYLVLQNALTAHVNGWVFNISSTNELGAPSAVGHNQLLLAAPPVGLGAQRTDFIFLEVWRILLSPAPSIVGKSPSALIWQNGNVKTDPANDLTLNFPDDIFDATLGVESTKRVQLQCRLRVKTNVNVFAYPYGLDDPSVVANTIPPNAATPDGTATAYNYVNQSVFGDAGLWVAGDGNPANSLGTVDGYMYAIPLCAVFRRNSTAFGPFSNLNGAGHVSSVPPSDRPDGLYNDQFVVDDIADLRMAVSPTGWNYQEVLDKNLTYLLDNSLRSEWMLTAFGGGTTGHSPFTSNQIGISTANGGLPPYSGDATGGGPRVAQFDNVCRAFSGRPIYEIMTVAVPAPGGGWANGSVVTINPSSLTVYPYAAFNWASFAPTNVQFIDVTRAVWEGTPPGKKRYDALPTTLPGTFHVINTSASVAATANNTVTVAPGDTLMFGSQPGVFYVVMTVTSSTITLTTPYTGTTTVASQAIDVQRNRRIASIQGLGTQPIGGVTITMGTIASLGLTNEPLYVDLLVGYPPAQGLSVTPTADFQASLTTFLVNNPATLPDVTPIFFDQTLLTTSVPLAPSEYFNATPALASLDWTHREARMVYTTSSINHVVLSTEASSELFAASMVIMPERVSAIVSVLHNGLAIVGTTALDVSGRVVTWTNPADYTSPGDTLQITYKALRPFPEAGEQVTIFVDQRAPQTARAQILTTPLPVDPRYIPKQLFAMTSGVSSPDYGYPFPTAYVQTGGVYAPAFAPLGAGEYEFQGEANISISDFNATTGLLALPVYVNYTPNPDQVSFIRAPSDLDSEGRTFFKQVSVGFYIPNAYGQNLSDIRRHKNFMAFLATLASNTPLGFAGQLVLVMLTRYGDNDETNGVFFDQDPITGLLNPGSTTAASIFRLRNNMLTK